MGRASRRSSGTVLVANVRSPAGRWRQGTTVKSEEESFSRVRKSFSYTNVALTLVLVFAMSGGAYAASKYVISSTKQISPKVLKALKGQAGVAGKQGVAGVAGPAGPEGKPGKEGTPGKEGALGKEGPVGKEGPAGKNGSAGSPWTAGGTLPSGKTLKGQWGVVGTASGEFSVLTNAVSYGIPLATEPIDIYYIAANTGEGEPANGEAAEAPAIREGKCKGTVHEPEAMPGYLCVFAKQEDNNISEITVGPGLVYKFPAICSWETNKCATEGPEPGSRFGFGMKTLAKEAGEVNDSGTWAVTEQ